MLVNPVNYDNRVNFSAIKNVSIIPMPITNTNGIKLNFANYQKII